MTFHKFLICILFLESFITAISQKGVIKDTTKPVAILVADSVLKNQKLPDVIKDAAKGLEQAQGAINGVYKNMRQDDAESEKQETALKEMAQTIKSLTWENVGYRQEIKGLKKENDELKKQIRDMQDQSIFNKKPLLKPIILDSLPTDKFVYLISNEQK